MEGLEERCGESAILYKMSSKQLCAREELIVPRIFFELAVVDMHNLLMYCFIGRVKVCTELNNNLTRKVANLENQNK